MGFAILVVTVLELNYFEESRVKHQICSCEISQANVRVFWMGGVV